MIDPDTERGRANSGLLVSISHGSYLRKDGTILYADAFGYRAILFMEIVRPRREKVFLGGPFVEIPEFTDERGRRFGLGEYGIKETKDDKGNPKETIFVGPHTAKVYEH